MRLELYWVSVNSMITSSELFLLLVGCQSTSSVARNLKADPVAKDAKSPIALASADEVVWKRSSAPSTAQSPDQWVNPPKVDDSVRVMGLRGPTPVRGDMAPAPLPE